MMGFRNIVILFLCIAFAFMVALPNPVQQGTSGFSYNNGTLDKIDQANQKIGANIASGSIDLPLLGTQFFPNPFALFQGFFELILSVAGIVPDTIGALVVLPQPLGLFLTVVFSFMILILGYSWWKGNDTS